MKNKSICSIIEVCITKRKEDIAKRSYPLQRFTHNKSTGNREIRVDNEARWTRTEKQIFWDVIRTHILKLLKETHFRMDQHNTIDIYFSKLDPLDLKHFCACRDVIRRNLWTGRYRKAVEHYLLTKEFFFTLFQTDLDVKAQLKELETIYFDAYYNCPSQ